MTRTVAREIAVHFAYELGFTPLSAVELLKDQLNPENFEILAKDEEIYQEYLAILDEQDTGEEDTEE